MTSIKQRMAVYGDVFLEWEERVIFKEKGQRVVHFFLKNLWGEAMLAVVGTERSKNHMVYVFSEDYFHHFGHTTTINPSTKWRTKREVVQWLTFLVTNRHQQLPTSNTMTSGTQSSFMTALPNRGIHVANEGALPRPESGEKSGIKKPFPFLNPESGQNSGVKKSTPKPESGGNSGFKVPIPKPVYGVNSGMRNSTLKPENGGNSGIKESNPEEKPGPIGQKLKLKLSTRGRPYDVGDKIEFLCQDFGMRRCWFKCQVLQVLKEMKKLEIQYDDILDEDGPTPEKLKEHVPFPRIAAADNLDMRCTGRLTVRPRPLEDLVSSERSYQVGAAVDAWWCDGWWEGVVTRFDVSSGGYLEVYLPGEHKLVKLRRTNVRPSVDWVYNKWVDVKPKPDIMSFINSSLTEVSKVSVEEPGNDEDLMALTLLAPEEKEVESTSKLSTPEDKEGGSSSKQSMEKIDTELKDTGRVLNLKRRWYNAFRNQIALTENEAVETGRE